MTEHRIDPNTNRPYGDHGTAVQAINYALDHEETRDANAFLRCWREGSLEEWPEFYVWLKAQDAGR